LYHEEHKQGQMLSDLLTAILPDLIRALPSPKQMRWHDGDGRGDAFLRPIRWIVAVLGRTPLVFEYAGVESGVNSCGHRVHGSKGALAVDEPFVWLEKNHVLADREQRIEFIRSRSRELTAGAGFCLLEDEDLFAETADLTEWPVPVLAYFSEAYLHLPLEVIRVVLKQHQRCFMSCQSSGQAANAFVAVANIQSKQPRAVIEGNERVVNARLADAAFYFARDPEQSLEQRVERLNSIVFQDGLGMIGDMVRRLRAFVLDHADALSVPANLVQRAAYLCKSDLTTGLVYEFPELQGYMGGVYASINGEDEAVAVAIAEHYMPVGADDALPESLLARGIGVAERVDKLLGYFHLGRIPTASADPFALRRAAIGLLRLLLDERQPIQLSLPMLLREAAKQWDQQRVTITIAADVCVQLESFIVERFLGMSESLGCSKAALRAALASSVERPLYLVLHIARLLTGFADTEAGQSVAAANKRIANILKKQTQVLPEIDRSLLQQDEELKLYAAMNDVQTALQTASLDAMPALLAGLRDPVDAFFDKVMVMCESQALRENRLALLAELRASFMVLADISRL